MKKVSILILSLVFCAFVFLPAGTVWAAQGITALNVAVLPPASGKYADTDTLAAIDAKIARHFRYPYYELIPSDKIYSVLSGLGPEFEAEKPYSEKVLKVVSQRLSADIVVIMELAKVQFDTYQRGRFLDRETYRTINVNLNCYTYSAQTGKYHKAKISHSSDEMLRADNGLDVILPSLAADVLNKTPYKTIPDSK